MSCGGDAATNRNAAAIRAALDAHPGAVTVQDARALFHRLADTERQGLADKICAARGSGPTPDERRDITQSAHAAARARIDDEIDAIKTVWAANHSNTETLAQEAADWAARDPRTAGILTPKQAAAEIHRIRRKDTVHAFTAPHTGNDPDRTAAALDAGPVEPGWGDAQRWLARAARDRAASCAAGRPDARTEDQQRWNALADRLDRAAK